MIKAKTRECEQKMVGGEFKKGDKESRRRRSKSRAHRNVDREKRKRGIGQKEVKQRASQEVKKTRRFEPGRQ